MKEVIKDENLVAFCGLYCGTCRAYLKEKCPGCRDNVKAKWCKIRSCCLGNDYRNCADCVTFPDPVDCKIFNNFISKAVSLITRSDRRADIAMIRERGRDFYAAEMARTKSRSIKK